MQKSSWMIAGGRMNYEMDGEQGRAAGSIIRMRGSVFGIALGVEEVVTEYAPPRRKAWRTTGEPELLVIGPYRMGFEVEARGSGSWLTVFIDYAQPAAGIARGLGHIFGGMYARWCVRRIAGDCERHFSAMASR